MGMTSRVDAAKASFKKSKKIWGLDVTGSVLASEAFFPFRDSIDAAAEAGVKCVIEPGGSIRDDEKLSKRLMSMGWRCILRELDTSYIKN